MLELEARLSLLLINPDLNCNTSIYTKMRGARLFTTVSALLAACVAASDVLDLTKDTFHSAVTPEDLMLVEFFARK